VGNERTLLVSLLCSLVPGRIADRVPLVVEHIVEARLLLVGQAEGDKLVHVERVTRNEHPNDPGVQLGTHGVKDRGDREVGEVLPDVLVTHVEAVSRPVNLVDHGENPLIRAVIIVSRNLRVADIDPVGRTVRDEHEGGDLNVLLLHPLLHEL